MNKLVLSAIAGALISGVMLAPSAKAATLVGDTITASYLYPTAGTVATGQFSYTNPTFTVGAGVETTLMVANLANPSITDRIDIDFSASAVTFTFLNAESRTGGTGVFNGPEFTITSGNPFAPITSVVSAGHTVTASLVSGVLEVNWAGQSFATNDTVVVNFASAVPEPSTWAMLVLGFAGIGTLAYRGHSIRLV